MASTGAFASTADGLTGGDKEVRPPNPIGPRAKGTDQAAANGKVIDIASLIG
jgi:hypothetical protein